MGILGSLGRIKSIRVWRQNSGMLPNAQGRMVQFGTPGAADITGILPDGRRLEIEVKTPTGRQSEQQKRYQAMIERFNGVYILARSVDEAVNAVKSVIGDG
jgi:hypothetical protein